MKKPLDPKATKSVFDREGFVTLPGFIEPREVDEILQHMDRFREHVAPRLPRAEVFYEDKSRPDTLKQVQRMQKYDPYFARLFASERFTCLAETLLNDSVTLEGLQWLCKPPLVGTPTPPHQDGYYFMIEPNEAITLWLALDVVDQTNGCVRYVPGSHRDGLRQHTRGDQLGFSQGLTYTAEDEKAEVPICAAPGDLLAHHSLTLHRADANQSDRPRRALGFTYFALRSRVDSDRQKAYQAKLSQDMLAAGKI